MKKSARFFLAMICVLGLVGCGTADNAEKAENKISQPVVEESRTSEEIDVVSAADDAQDSQSIAGELSQPEEIDHQKDFEGQILLLDSEMDSIALNDEELGNIQKIIESGTWNEETAECIDDCLISIDGMDYYYHRECGTINDKMHRRHMILNNEDKEMVNSIIANGLD